jgi:hypothetical protein
MTAETFEILTNKEVIAVNQGESYSLCFSLVVYNFAVYLHFYVLYISRSFQIIVTKLREKEFSFCRHPWGSGKKS